MGAPKGGKGDRPHVNGLGQDLRLLRNRVIDKSDHIGQLGQELSVLASEVLRREVTTQDSIEISTSAIQTAAEIVRATDRFRVVRQGKGGKGKGK